MSIQLTKSPIFIVGCARSGTTLTRSLLDGHPDLLVFPVEIKFFRFTRFPTLFVTAKQKHVSTTDVVKPILDSRGFEFLRTREEGNLDYLDYQRFRHYLELATRDHEGQNAAVLVEFFKALLHSRGHKPEEVDDFHVVEKTPFQEEHALVLRDWFPNAKFIHVVRNPYAILCSLRGRRGWYDIEAFPYLREALRAIIQSFHFLSYNREALEGYHVVKYEDLARDTESVMRSLCTRLELDFDPVLLQPTRLGVPYSGHSSFGKGASKSWGAVREDLTSRWQGQITDLEIELINSHCRHILQAFDYPAVESEKPWRALLPARGERLKVYLGNRILLEDAQV